jgi:hypothetical protein
MEVWKYGSTGEWECGNYFFIKKVILDSQVPA